MLPAWLARRYYTMRSYFVQNTPLCSHQNLFPKALSTVLHVLLVRDDVLPRVSSKALVSFVQRFPTVPHCPGRVIVS